MIILTIGQTYKTKIRLFDSKKDYKVLEKLKEVEVFNNKGNELFFDLKLNREGNVYVSLDKDNKEEIRTLAYKLAKRLNNEKVKQVSLEGRGFKEIMPAFLEGLLMANYHFSYKKETPKFETEISLLNVEANLVEEVTNVINGVFVTRDLVNTPAIDLYPESYADRVVELFKGTAVEVEVLGKKEIENLNMAAFLAVNKGSDNDPRFIILRYLPIKDKKDHLTIVGKGVTYDTGGYALKPATSMVNMHNDMAGSATVVGLFKALNDNNICQNVVGIMALTENMISGKAYKNGDIISSMKGLTIEVGNTDAEGRLTLADALYYAATKLNTTNIIELSTLTGACVVALGTDMAGAVSTSDKLYNDVYKHSVSNGEVIWRLPMIDPLKEVVKGTFGDLKNSIPGGAGAITAGVFLTNFVEDKPYLHIDIAGPAHRSKRRYYEEGATGFGVRTLYNYIKSL